MLRQVLLCSFAFYCAGLSALVDAETKEKIMKFDISDILEVYQEQSNVSARRAKMIEQELKRFLVLRTQEDVRMFSKEVDSLLHLFILHTERWKQFCQDAAGKNITHKPLTQLEQQQRNLPREKTYFVSQYAQNFNETPPTHIWNNLQEEKRKEPTFPKFNSSYLDSGEDC